MPRFAYGSETTVGRSSSEWRRAIRLSFGPMEDITAANNTSAQLAERIRWVPTSTRAPIETGIMVVKSLAERGEEREGQPLDDPDALADTAKRSGAETPQHAVESREQDDDRQITDRKPADRDPT